MAFVVFGAGPLVPLIVQWGAELLLKASKNYSSGYSSDVQRLLTATYAGRPGPGVPGQPTMGGYGAPQYGAPPYGSAQSPPPYRAPQYGNPQSAGAAPSPYGVPPMRVTDD
jgi:hypothetical protein